MSEKTKFLEGGQEPLGTLKTAPQWQSLFFFSVWPRTSLHTESNVFLDGPAICRLTKRPVLRFSQTSTLGLACQPRISLVFLSPNKNQESRAWNEVALRCLATCNGNSGHLMLSRVKTLWSHRREIPRIILWEHAGHIPLPWMSVQGLPWWNATWGL